MSSLRSACARLISMAAVAAVALLMACATPAERFERRAAQLGFTSMLLHGDGFDHRVYIAQAGQGGDTLHVYIEHDGTPWAAIDRVSDDPTPRMPYALELMARDAGARLMLGRPCYLRVQVGPSCTPSIWTHERYSPQVVASMAAALRRYLSSNPYRHVVLIGYSGGGTLAWLMAARLPETTAVVTIAANLDIDAWARLHGYSPLAGSLDPALSPPLPPAIVQRHYVGERDANVPPSIVRSFARRQPEAAVIEIAGFDHVCCWLERWPRLLASAGVPTTDSRHAGAAGVP